MSRLQKGDTRQQAAMKMATEEGQGVHPGALALVLGNVLKRGVPGEALLVLLDVHEIYGADIYYAFHDVCNRDMRHLIAALTDNPLSLKNAIALAKDGLL
jgi:hypothetical protein